MLLDKMTEFGIFTSGIHAMTRSSDRENLNPLIEHRVLILEHVRLLENPVRQ